MINVIEISEGSSSTNHPLPNAPPLGARGPQQPTELHDINRAILGLCEPVSTELTPLLHRYAAMWPPKGKPVCVAVIRFEEID